MVPLTVSEKFFSTGFDFVTLFLSVYNVCQVCCTKMHVSYQSVHLLVVFE